MTDKIERGCPECVKPVESPTKRLDWDNYYLNLCKVISERSTCTKAHHGAIITWNNRIISAGYNGSLPGQPNCYETHCHRLSAEDKINCVAMHAETNAITQCTKLGIRLEGSTLYSISSPCWECAKIIVASGISMFVYKKVYRDQRGLQLMAKCGIFCYKIEE